MTCPLARCPLHRPRRSAAPNRWARDGGRLERGAVSAARRTVTGRCRCRCPSRAQRFGAALRLGRCRGHRARGQVMAWGEELTTVALERGPALVGYAYLLTGDLDSARDLVQEALVRTYGRPRSASGLAWV